MHKHKKVVSSQKQELLSHHPQLVQQELGVDFNGADVKGASQNPSYVGLSGGYAWFVGNRVSFEPNIRYDISTNDTFKNVFSAGLGINVFFK